MKKVLKGLSITYYIILFLLLILFIFLFFEEKKIDILLKIITPLITLFTGVIIFYSFREGQKANKYIISKEIYGDFIERLDKAFTKPNLDISNIVFRNEEVVKGKIERQPNIYIEIIEKCTINDWMYNFQTLLDSVKKDISFKEIIEKFDNKEINMGNFNNFSHAYLPDRVDAILYSVRDYYTPIQNFLLNLLKNNYEDIHILHRNLLIEKIINESLYRIFLLSIGRYFDLNKKGKLNLTKECSEDNIEVLNRGVNKITKRKLIKWDILSELYKNHQELLKIMENTEYDITKIG